MRVSKVDGKYVLALYKGDEVVDCLNEFCKKERIFGGYFLGIGACESIELGTYNVEEKKYYKKKFESGLYEITNLSGNVTSEKIHMHVTIAEPESCKAFGGHLIWAKINPALEIVLVPFSSELQREHDEKSGLDLLKLDEEI